MKSTIIETALVAACSFFISCHIASEPTSEPPSRSLDTLSRNVTPGIVLRVDSLKDEYALDESISAQLRLINIGDTAKLVVHTGNFPPYTWHVNSMDSANVVAYPTIIFPAEFRDTLGRGDTLTFSFNWPQTPTDLNTIYSGLKATSGKYRMVVVMSGNSLFQPLHKYFTINEVGEPMSVILGRDFTYSDSIIVALVARNRTTRTMSYTYLNPGQIEMSLVKAQDTLLYRTFSTSLENVTFGPRSTVNLFRFSIAKSDTSMHGFKGTCSATVTARFAQVTLSATRTVAFF